MKIEDNRSSDKIVRFKDLSKGDVFSYDLDDDIYLKVYDGNYPYGISLVNNTVVNVSGNTMVKPIKNVRLVIE